MGLPSYGLNTRRGSNEGQVQRGLGSGQGGMPQLPGPPTQLLTVRMSNINSLGGKDAELVWEVERYRLDIVGLKSTHSLGSENSSSRGLDALALPTGRGSGLGWAYS